MNAQKSPNIVFDFTVNKTMENLIANQPVALMPAALAQKLLTTYAERLVKASPQDIIAEHIDSLLPVQKEGNLAVALDISLNWLQERDLIQNIAAKKFDLYTVKPEEKRPEAVTKGPEALQ